MGAQSSDNRQHSNRTFPNHGAELAGWLAWQDSLAVRTIDLRLERCRRMAARMNLLTPPYFVVTVGGTNGKGTTVDMLATSLRYAGYRVGAYYSPWLLRFNECAKVDGRELSDDEFIRSFRAVEDAREGGELTPFEYQTLAVAEAFRHCGVDIAVLEVGLGGARDAVNVFGSNLAVLTSIGLDHADWLGNTREAVAAEKSGIFRAGAAAVCGDSRPPATLINVAQSLRVKLYIRTRDFYAEPQDGENWRWHGPTSQIGPLPLPAGGNSRALVNASTVQMALELLSGRFPTSLEARQRGLLDPGVPGRQQLIATKPRCLVDVAHNPDAARALRDRLKIRARKGRIFAVLAMLSNKDAEGFVSVLDGLVDRWYVGATHGPRGQHSDVLARRCRTVTKSPVFAFDTVEDAFESARTAAEPEDLIVASGSFACVRQVMRLRVGDGTGAYLGDE